MTYLKYYHVMLQTKDPGTFMLTYVSMKPKDTTQAEWNLGGNGLAFDSVSDLHGNSRIQFSSFFLHVSASDHLSISIVLQVLIAHPAACAGFPPL